MNQHHDSFDATRRRLGLTGISAATVGLAGLLSSSARADLRPEGTFTGNVAYSLDTLGGSISWDPFGDEATTGNNDYMLNAAFSCWGAFLQLRPGDDFSFNVEFAACSNYALLFQPGDTIDSGAFYDAAETAVVFAGYSVPVTQGGSLYFGYRFNFGDGDYAYGWAQFEEIGSSIRLAQWGYSTEGEVTIPLGEAIPEPSTYAAITGLFFAGVVAFSRWKKRRALAA